MSNGINFGLPATDLGGGLAGIGRLLSLSSEQARKRELSGQVGTSLQAGDYAGAAKAAFDAGDTDTGLGLVKLGQVFKKQQLEDKASAGFFGEMDGLAGSGFGGGQGGSPLANLGKTMGQGAPDPSRAVPSFADSASPAGGYLTSLTRRESNGNPNAKNPNSTATGLGQFTEGTWNDLARRQPGLGLTPNGRTDPQQAMRATAAFTAENEALLTRAGLPVTDVTRYSMHFLGKQGGLRFLKGAETNPDALASSYADAASVRANRNVFFNRDGSPKTARQVLGDFNGSFGGGRRGPAPAPSQVAYAGNEDETQALEQRMGMMPTQTAEADMPMQGAREAAFYIPGSEPAAPGAPPTRSPFGGDGSQGPAIEQSALGSRQAPGQGVGRVMTMPGAGGALGGAPGGIGPVAAGPGVGEAPGGAGGFPASGPLAQRIPVLLRASANPNLPEGQRQLAQTLLKSALDETKMSDAQKDYVLAKGQGFAGSFLDYQRELKRSGGPTVLSAGQTVYDEKTNTGRYTAPDRGSKVTGDVDDRRQAVVSQGLDPNDPRYREFILTGSIPKETQSVVTAGDRKAINEAEDQALQLDSTLDTLARAKELNNQTFTGVTAGTRGWAGTTIPGAGLVLDPKASMATAEFGKIMSMEAIKSMSQTLKGATTDREMDRFVDILGDPATPPEIRGRTIDRMMMLAQRQKELAASRVTEMRGGTYYRPGGGSSAGGPQQRAMPPSREVSAGAARGAPAGGGPAGGPGSVPVEAPRGPAALPDLEAEARRRGLIR